VPSGRAAGGGLRAEALAAAGRLPGLRAARWDEGPAAGLAYIRFDARA
jgi:hypothetical protein